jgi:hypothetical protein
MNTYINYYYESKLIASSNLDSEDIPVLGSGITLNDINYRVVLLVSIDSALNIYLEKL